MKKNGFIMSSYVYMLLVFFLLVILSMLTVFNNSRLLSNKLKSNNTKLTVNLNGGISSQTFSSSYSPVSTLSLINPTRSEYIFIGWTVTGEGASINGSELTIGTSDTTITANWIPLSEVSKSYAYTGSEQTFTAPISGYYQLEVWGAQGGKGNNVQSGYGGYSIGTIPLNSGDKLYINVGGMGSSSNTKAASSVAGGYNGGGNGFGHTDKVVSGGGGATHIATVSGQLKTLSSSIGSILIVAGGGGGSAYENANSIGGSGGGMNGVASQSYSSNYTSTGATQTGSGTGYYPGSFGLGGCNVSVNGCSGGGGGYYGGDAARYAGGGAGGSGYIGNSLLTNKAMYCYNCSESSEVNTKTISTTNVSEEAISNYAKSGNGYALIEYIGVGDVTLTVNLNGGSTSQTFSSSYIPRTEVVLVEPTRAGYIFAGWTVSGTGADLSNDTLTIGEEDATLTANWIEIGDTFYPVISYSCNNASVGSEPYALSYTGDCEVIDDGDLNWRVKFLTNGTLTISHNEEVIIDSFLVGGGGKGGTGNASSNGGGGGGAGYTATYKAVDFGISETYTITVGAGSTSAGSAGGTSSIVGESINHTAAGGKSANNYTGGAGGSGGGSGGYGIDSSNTTGGSGGTNGADGKVNVRNQSRYGTGQHTTTCEFGEGVYGEEQCNNGVTMYAKGGGGAPGTGRRSDNNICNSGVGYVGGAGSANTGNGGNGGRGGCSQSNSGGNGGSGIVIIRNARGNNVKLARNKVTLNGNTIGYYTGISEVIDDGNGDWRIKFLTGGIFAYEGDTNIDIFLVGGGGKGGTGNASSNGGGGGGAGYTATYKNVNIGTENLYTIIVGEGSTLTSSSGEASSFTGGSIEYIAAGGKSANEYTGGAGGSGGGSGGYGIDSSNTTGGSGGTNGTDGKVNERNQSRYGTGQHTTTCEFEEGIYGEEQCNNGVTLYAKGGGGAPGTGRRSDNNICNSGVGYAGGAGSANTGNGGNGGRGGCSQSNSGGNGGSGIVIIRNTR